MSEISVGVFGGLDVTGPDGTSIAVSGNKQQALLAYLVMNTDNPPSRDRVMTLLWGDRFTDQARQSLRQGLSKLRQAIDPDGIGIIVTENDRLAINPDLVDVDWVKFQLAAAKSTPQADAQAVDLFCCTLLDGLYVREAAFDEWLLAERVRMSEVAFPVFERLAAFHLKNSDQAKSQATATQLIEIDPLRESSHRLLMRILAQSGQRAAAIKQYNNCAELLKRELEVEPDPETQQLLADIKNPAPVPSDTSDKSAQKDQTSNVAKVGAESSRVRISVLNFICSADGSEIAEFADGLSWEVNSSLTRFRWLEVVAQPPSDADVPTLPQLRKMATTQNVSYVVQGSVRELSEILRITLQLVDIETGKYVLVQRYDRPKTNLFDMQDELSEVMSASIESELVAYEGERVKSLGSDALNAWDSYHLGLAVQYEFSIEGNSKAQSLFRRAIAQDPMFAAAHARLSYAMVLSAVYFEADETSGLLDEALELAHKATRLDDQDAVARFALGRAHLARGEYRRSITELEYAIELNPSMAQAHCGLGDSLAYLGRAEEAIPNFEEAVRLSPHDPHRWAFSMYAAIACIFNGEYEQAEDWAQKSVRVANSHYLANAAMVSVLGHLGRTDAARDAVQELLELKPDFTCDFARERLFYLRDEKQIDRYVQGLKLAGVPCEAD
ncbi:MAG: BTAD domain-containing putative transcriptional regulator [Paracoccaceae bacterium]